MSEQLKNAERDAFLAGLRCHYRGTKEQELRLYYEPWKQSQATKDSAIEREDSDE